jgi:integrase/recombinase XerC
MITTWDDSLDRFLAHVRAKGRSSYTLRNYTADLRRFAEWWSLDPNRQELTPSSITEYDLEGFSLYLQDQALGKDDRTGQKPATVNAKLSAVRSYLTWAVKLKHITEVPQCEPVTREEDEPKGLERTEELALIRTVAAGRKKRDLAIFEIELNTGVRVAELVAICWRDIEMTANKGTLTIRAGKGRKWRTVPLNKTARKAFTVLKTLAGGRVHPDWHVFKSQREHGDLSARGVESMVARYGAKAGLPGLHPHVLRHTYAYRLIDEGVDIATIARLLGHRSVQTTMRYLRRREGSLQAAVDKLDSTPLARPRPAR